MSGEQAAVRSQVWYAAALSVTALVVVAWATATYPVRDLIALHLPGLEPATALLAGVGYWTLFGLLGALRSRQLEAGTVLTFHMPFVVAGTILGGPVVGGWMGLLSQFERREFASVPWFGLLGNHAMIAIAAVAAGLAGDSSALLVRGLGADDGTVQFFGAAAVALVFVSVNFLLVLPLVAIRRKGTLREAVRNYDGGFRATVLAEGILAWLMALVYLAVGWWAPIVCVALVLVVWRAHDTAVASNHDHMTGLLNERGFAPYLAAATAEARSGRRLHALLVMDLDNFGAFNRDHGTHAGDEVIRAAAGRLRSAVRDTDHVARSHRAGDEFHVLLTDLPDASTAMALTWRIHARVGGALQLRASDQIVAVSGSIGLLLLDGEAPPPMRAIEIADARMQRAKHNSLGICDESPDSKTGLAATA